MPAKLFLFLLLVSGYFSSAQDSILERFPMAQDSILDMEIAKIDNLITNTQLDTAEEKVNDLYKILNKKYSSNKYLEKRVLVHFLHGLLKDKQYQHNNALSIYLDVLKMAEKNNLYRIACHAKIHLALNHSKAGHFDLTYKYLEDARKVCEKYQFEDIYSTLYIRYAQLHRSFGFGDKTELGDQRERLEQLGFRASVDSAFYYTRKAIEFAKKYNIENDENDGYVVLGHLNSKVGKYSESSFYYLKSLAFWKKISNFQTIANMYTNVASNYIKDGKLKDALIYSDSAMLNYKDLFVYHKYNVSKQRATIYTELGLMDSAYHYLQLAYVDREKAHNEAELSTTKKLEEQYQNDKKEEIISNRNKLLILTTIVILIIMALALLMFRQNRRIRKQNVLINNMLAHKQKLAESKSLFYANASHELRTPLTLILEPLDTLLKDRNLNEEQRMQLLTIARQGGITLKNLVSQILDLSKLDGGNMQLHLKPTRVHAFFGILLAQFESLGHTKRLQYVTEIYIPEDLVAMLDQEKCRQIISNLISNAVKFTERDGKVHVTVRYIDGILKLNVSDTGRGIDGEDLPYVFDRYFQATKKDELAQGGMGIGLALCRDYAELMGGNISVTSVPQEGSSFSVELPLELVDDLQEEDFIFEEEYVENLQLITKSDTGKPTLLVVEDNSTLQHYLHLLLSEDYEVLLAENGEVALEIIKNSQKVDLIVSDLMMPVMDGYQLLTALKSNAETSDIPVIMLTARAEKDERLRALRIGVDDYITKPFENEELRIRIANLLKNYQVRKLALQENVEDNLGHSEADKAWMETFDVFIQKIYLKSTINIPDLAEEFAMSESSLLRKLKQLTGLSPQQYIQELRLNRAYELLDNSTNNYSVQQIALKIGYKDTRSFSRAFKNRFGKLPSAVISE
jgi:signal transduction histidine kinase/DNA-binding response OmpR family regulator